MNKKLFIVLSFFLITILGFSQKVEVTFFIKDFENQKELNEVQVFVADSLIGKTNAEGFLTVKNLKSGLNKISITKDQFNKIEEEKELQNGGFYEYTISKATAIAEVINTKQDSPSSTPVVVVPPVVEKKEQNTSVFKAKAKYASETQALTEQRKASEIKEIRSGEELSRKGASNVSKGVEKGAGITNVQGRGIFVRGLEDRYNNLLINGLAVPSNNPFTKIIDLSLIPNDVVGNLEIYKTYNSNLYADFAGATINIETITPQKPVTRINIGASYITDNNLSKFLINSRQNSIPGFFGLTGKERGIPGLFGSDPVNFPKTIAGQSALNNFKSGYNVNEINSINNSSYGLFHAGKFSRRLSYLVTSNFDNKYQIRNGVDRLLNLGTGDYQNSFQTSEYAYTTNFSTLAALTYKLDRGSLNLNTTYLKSTEALIKDQLGFFNAGVSGNNRLIRTNQFQESNYLNIQLLGDYFLTEDKKHKIKGGVSYNKNSLVQPDRNFILGEKISENEISIQYPGNLNLNRQFLDVDGKYFISGMAEYDWFFNKENEYNKISVGLNGFVSSYESQLRVLSPISNFSSPFITGLNNIDQQINLDLQTNKLSFNEVTREQYKSLLDDVNLSPYVNIFYQFSDKLQANVGVRAEIFNREISYKKLGDFLFREIKNNNLNVLPALNVKYAVDKTSNIRLAVSQTTTRPTIMEANPLQYSSPDQSQVLGNADLEFSTNTNVDLKFEIFPSSNEIISTSIFGKNIQNPIERGIAPIGNSGAVTFFNSKNANILGAEVEFIFALKRIANPLKNFKLGANASYLYTDVEIDRVKNPVETFDKRALQGASNWIVNADLKYDFKFNKEWQNTLSTVFNVYGKRIYSVGATGFDHVYENPMPTLDMVWSSTLSDHWRLNFNASNILNPTYRLEHGNNNTKPVLVDSLVLREFKKGVTLGLTATYIF